MAVDPKELKSRLIEAAYVGAQAVLGNLNPVTLDSAKDAYAEFQNPELRKRALLVYEEAKIQYAAIVAAVQDNTIWPDPVLATVAAVVPKPAVALPGQDIGANLGGVVSALAGVSPVVAGVLSAVTNTLGK